MALECCIYIIESVATVFSNLQHAVLKGRQSAKWAYQRQLGPLMVSIRKDLPNLKYQHDHYFHPPKRDMRMSSGHRVRPVTARVKFISMDGALLR